MTPNELVGFQEVLEDALRRDLKRAARRRRHGVFGAGATAGCAAAVFLALGIVGAGASTPPALAYPIARALKAISGPADSVLHIDSSLISTGGGHTWSTEEDYWQQQRGNTCNWLNIRRSAPRALAGTPEGAGAEGGSYDGHEMYYVARSNTIYVAPRTPPSTVKPTGGQVPARFRPASECEFGVGFAVQARQLLSSGKAYIAGHPRVSGKRALEIVANNTSSKYYVSADGKFTPLKFILNDQYGTDTWIFHVFRRLPASDGYLIDIRRRHPSARVVNRFPI